MRNALIHPFPLLIVAVGFALRLYTLASESLWYDELLQLDIAQGSLAAIFPELRKHSGVPLDYLIGHFWLLGGHNDGWVRLPAVLVGTLTLPIAYQFGRRLLSRSEAILLMTLLALAPFHIRYSQEVRPYALVVLGVTLAGYAFWRFWQTGRWRYFIPLQIGVLIFSLAHIFATVVFVPFLLFLAANFIVGPRRKRTLKLAGALILSGVVPLLIFGLMDWGDVLFRTSKSFGEALVQPDKFTANMSDEPKPITGPEIDWPFIREKILAPFAGSESLIVLIYFNGLVILGAIHLIIRKRIKLVLLLLLWIGLPPLLIVALLIFRNTFFAPRYIISILPVYLILLSAGVFAVPRLLTANRFAPGVENVGHALNVTTWATKLSRLERGLQPLWCAPNDKQFSGRRSAVSGHFCNRAILLWGGLFVAVTGLILASYIAELSRYYGETDKEQWHLVADFIAANAGPDDAVIAFHAEPTMNWYYPSARAVPNYYDELETIQASVAQTERSWVILSLFSSEYDAQTKAWLSEQQAIRFVLDPLIHVYYLGNNASPDQLLAEVQNFALPVDHVLYASLARENRRRPEVARQYYRLAIAHAPDDKTRATYQAALEALK